VLPGLVAAPLSTGGTIKQLEQFLEQIPAIARETPGKSSLTISAKPVGVH
jgi:hypothetical protein